MSSLFMSSSLRSESPQDKLARWKVDLKAWGVSDRNLNGVVSLLSKLFLPVRSAVEGMEYGREWLEEVAQKKGVGHADYFSRYFFFGIPSDDISDFIIERALTKLSVGDSAAEEVRLLSRSLKQDPERAIRKKRPQRTC
jgi:hypothetical protein